MNYPVKFFLILFPLLLVIPLSLAISPLIVQETDLVKIKIDTFDPDGDNVSVVYSAPLDENGEWQTTYGDAGEYTTLVTVTDGKSINSQEYDIIVKKKNQAPEINIEDQIELWETDKVKLKPQVTDPNGDKVEVQISSPFNEGEWQTDYDDAGEYTVTISASDGELESTRLVKVLVQNKNRLPVVEVEPKAGSVEAKENEELVFSAQATDADQDPLVYLWELDGETVSWENTYYYLPDFNSAGEHQLKLSVSDGNEEVIREWQINVLNTNRAPVLPELADLYVKEGENVSLALPETDEDGDALTYTVDEPLGADLSWETTFDDAGEYEFEIEVTDGELSTQGTIKIFVENVDRAPVMSQISDLSVNESAELTVYLSAEDPDGDEVYFWAEGFPEGALLEDKKIVWQPGYDFVQRPAATWAKLLNRLSLDKYLWQKKTLPITLMACGSELCTNQTFKVIVYNVNRPPQLTIVKEVTLNETNRVKVKPKAFDPDGDYVKFYFTQPLNHQGEWEPTYQDAGEYSATVGATDGFASVEEEIELTVKNVNRQPVMAKIANRVVNEGEDVWIKVDATDPDQDELEVWTEGAPDDSTFKEQLFHWIPSYSTITERKNNFLNNFLVKSKFLNRKFSQEKVNVGVNFAVSDGDFTVSKLVNIAVRNWNRAPEITNATEATQAYVGEPVIFAAEAFDPDGDELTYSWDFGLMKGGLKDTKKISRKFSSAGEKKITLTISDGRDSVEKTWTVNVLQKKTVKPVEVPKEEPKPQPQTKPQAQPQPAPQPVQPTFVTYEI